MILKNSLLIIISVFIISNSFSQKLDKGFQFISEKKYDKAIDIFEKSIEKKSELIASKYGLALVYSSDDYTKKNYYKAFRYLDNIDSKFDKISSKEEIEKYNLSKETVLNLKEDLAKRAFVEIKDQNSLYNLNTFLSKYTNTKENERIKKVRDSIAYNIAVRENTYSSYQDFYETYTDASQVPAAKMEFEKTLRKLYSDAANDGELRTLDKFKEDFVNYPFYDKNSTNDRLLALTANSLQFNRDFKIANEADYRKYIIDAAPKDLALVALQRLISLDLKSKNYKSAIEKLKEFSKYFPNDSSISKIIKTIQAPDKKMVAAGISDSVNSPGFEYAPYITTDGKILYFCGLNRQDNLITDNEDILTSQNINGKWQKPEQIKELNTPIQHEAPLSVSADGNRLLMYSSSDIYYTEKTEYGWGLKSLFPAINEPNSWEADAMVTSDGEAVIFISDRHGNAGNYHSFNQNFHGTENGNTDIYVSRKTKSGWSKPINMGKVINTPFSERSPFMHPDMKTMYFSSEGHGSLGRLDVYKTTRLSDTSWTQWSDPINMGKEINSFEDEYNYRISTDGSFAYFSTVKDYNYDIFTINLPEELRPKTVTTVTGKIKDQNGNMLYASVKWENLESGETIGDLNSDMKTGNYIIILPNGKNYGFFAEKANYYPVSGNIDLSEIKTNQTIERDIVLVSIDEIIKNNISVTLNNLFFDTNKYILKQESFPELKRFADFIKSHPELSAEISGYTDNKGTTEANLKLSQNRAEAVKNYLLSIGCENEKLTAKGFGADKPIENNETEQGRAKNRRVEFKIIK